MSRGQVTILKDAREISGVSTGDLVTFIVGETSTRMVNSAVYAMQVLQTDSAKNMALLTDPGLRSGRWR